jgi:hypothetical protein
MALRFRVSCHVADFSQNPIIRPSFRELTFTGIAGSRPVPATAFITIKDMLGVVVIDDAGGRLIG